MTAALASRVDEQGARPASYGDDPDGSWLAFRAMGASERAPAQRILELAAYLKEQAEDGRPVTLDLATAELPGYPTDVERDENGRLVEGGRGYEALRKQFRRDLRHLEEHFGIEVDFDAADNVYRLRRPFFTREERAGLIAAAAAVAVHADPAPDLAELGAAVDADQAEVFLRLHSLVLELRAAIDECRPVRFDYAGRHRTLEPYSLGYWRNRWYVAGRDTEADALRTFRLDRIDGPAIEAAGDAGGYEIPTDFKADGAFEFDADAWGADPPVRARVRVGADHAPALCRALNGVVLDGNGDDDGGDTIVEAGVRNYAVFRDRVLAFREHAVVVAPPELVTLVRDWLDALAGTR